MWHPHLQVGEMRWRLYGTPEERAEVFQALHARVQAQLRRRLQQPLRTVGHRCVAATCAQSTST